MSWFYALDAALLRLINHPADRAAPIDRLVFDVADSHLVQGGFFLAMYWAFWFDKRVTDKERSRSGLVAAVLSGVVVAVLARVVQLSLPFHARPLHTPDIGLRLPIGIDPASLNAWSSFPSDHAVLFFALCVPIWQRSRALGALAFLWTLVVVCLPRIYLGYHWPSDIAAGAVVGVVLMLGVQKLVTLTGVCDRIVGWEARYSRRFYAVAFLLTFELALLFSDLRHFGLDLAKAGYAVLDISTGRSIVDKTGAPRSARPASTEIIADSR